MFLLLVMQKSQFRCLVQGARNFSSKEVYIKFNVTRLYLGKHQKCCSSYMLKFMGIAALERCELNEMLTHIGF